MGRGLNLISFKALCTFFAPCMVGWNMMKHSAQALGFLCWMLLWVPCSQALTARCWRLWCGWHFSIRCCSSLVEWWLIPVARPGQISKTLGYIENMIENIRKLGWRLADSWLRLRVTSQLKLSADRLRGEHHLRSLAAWHGVGTSASVAGQVF